MAIYVTKSADWKQVKNSGTVKKECPRCHNTVDFQLVSEHALKIAFIPLNTIYALHCPICIHVEDIDKADANRLMR